MRRFSVSGKRKMTNDDTTRLASPGSPLGEIFIEARQITMRYHCLLIQNCIVYFLSYSLSPSDIYISPEGLAASAGVTIFRSQKCHIVTFLAFLCFPSFAGMLWCCSSLYQISSKRPRGRRTMMPSSKVCYAVSIILLLPRLACSNIFDRSAADQSVEDVWMVPFNAIEVETTELRASRNTSRSNIGAESTAAMVERRDLGSKRHKRKRAPSSEERSRRKDSNSSSKHGRSSSPKRDPSKPSSKSRSSSSKSDPSKPSSKSGTDELDNFFDDLGMFLSLSMSMPALPPSKVS